MKISLGSDHAGFRYKEKIKKHLLTLGHHVEDFGASSEQSCDYPDFVGPSVKAVADGNCDKAIVFGGSGNGEAMVANRFTGVRCGLCWNVESAKMTL